MNYTVLITDTRTGETRKDKNNLAGDWDDGVEYLWSDGNFGCDCNRSLFFARAANVPENEIDESPCGHTHFRITVKVGDEIVYEEPR